MEAASCLEKQIRREAERLQDSARCRLRSSRRAMALHTGMLRTKRQSAGMIAE
jgi:hypothetical protein